MFMCFFSAKIVRPVVSDNGTEIQINLTETIKN